MRIGVDLGGTKTEAIVLGDDGSERARLRVDSPQGSYPATVEQIRKLVDAVAHAAGCPATIPVGVGIPGAISPKTGLVKNANSTWLIGHAFDRDLESALKRPVRLANDANCFAVSEAIDGAAKGYGVVFGVILGTGTGGGIAINGRPHTGINAISGEWGHNPLPWPRVSEQTDAGSSEYPGFQCYCGKLGCIETFLSGPGLSRDYAASGGISATAREIAALADSGDNRAIASLQRYLDRLARAVAGVINILDPDIIVFGGGLSHLSVIYETLPKILGTYVFSDVCDTPCVRNVHGDSSGVRGAAWLWPDQKG